MNFLQLRGHMDLATSLVVFDRILDDIEQDQLIQTPIGLDWDV
jgi:hypothetical protein